MFDLTGKVAVVTGASSGMGADAAMGYAQAGADVAILARRKEKLDAVAEKVRAATGRKVLAIQCDVKDVNQIQAAVEAIMAEFGHIDILLNNAGRSMRGGVDTMSEELWDDTMDTNLKSMFYMCKFVVPHMIEQNYGKIVNVASLNALIGDKEESGYRHAYNASKAGVLGLTLGMACSYGKYNITVNAVAPGPFKTEITMNGLYANPAFESFYNNLCPMGRTPRDGELNGTLLYLSSDASSYVTGQLIAVSGGCELV